MVAQGLERLLISGGKAMIRQSQLYAVSCPFLYPSLKFTWILWEYRQDTLDSQN